jgi:hypothetical protein
LKKTYFSIAILGSFFSIGVLLGGAQIFSNGEEGIEIKVPGDNPVARDPAAIRRSYDFSALEGSALEVATKNRLLAGLKSVRENNEVGVGLGHFVLKGPEGEKTFGCQKYSRISMVFEGDGAAINGELPVMEVEGDCEVSSDINAISPLYIPVAKILGEPVGDGEFNFKENKPISVKFANVVDQWPTIWSLKSVRLFDGPDGKNQITISPEELHSLTGKPFILNFK